jgi:hypothetical protein
LLSVAGWLGALIGCVEYDTGRHVQAEATRRAVADLAQDAGNAELLAWTFEMAAWFALTQGRHRHARQAVEAGRTVAGSRGVAVQLIAHDARAVARLGDIDAVQRLLDEGSSLLAALPRPDHPENHFTIDPDKWDFYAMDAFRLVGDNQRAAYHAREVLRLGHAADGTEKAPMRVAEARLTLGVVAARNGELEEAVAAGMAGFDVGRRSLPSLLLVGQDLKAELGRRYPRDRRVREFDTALRSITAS